MISAAIRLEFKRNKTRVNLVCLAVYLLLSLVILQLGIEKIKLEEKQRGQFIESQVKRIAGFINYHQYGGFGINRLLIASPLLALFHNSSTLDELQAIVDVSVRNHAYKPEMGKNLFTRPTGGSLDYSWFVLIFYSGLISLWSFFALRNKDYNRFINSKGLPGVYWGIIAGRIILVVLSLALMSVITWAQFLVNGIALPGAELGNLVIFYLTAALILSILTVVIAGLGAVKNWKSGVVKAAAFWIILVFIWPEALNAVFSRLAEVKLKSLEQCQIQKNEKLLPLEKQALENTGRYTEIPDKEESDRKSAEHYWEVVSKEIKAIDLGMVEDTERISRLFQFWSIFNPVTFYKSVNNEVGSKGYNSYNRFFRENLEIQRGFLRYVFNKRYYENYSKVEPYLPEDQLVVRANSGLPGYFGLGVLLNLVYLGAALVFGYRRFKRFMYPKAEAPGGYADVEIETGTGRVAIATCEREDLSDQLVNVFSGKRSKGFNGVVRLSGREVDASGIEDVGCVPGQAKIPGHFRLGEFFATMAKIHGIKPAEMEGFNREYREVLHLSFCQLKPVERACALLDYCRIKGHEVVVLLDVYRGILSHDWVQVNAKIKALKEKGGAVLSLSDHHMSVDNLYIFSYDRDKGLYLDLEKEVKRRREAEKKVS